MFALFALLALLVQEPGTGTPRTALAALTLAALEEEIDRSLHWLRLRYDPTQGSYGSLEADARALAAFAASPRRYRASEGPFLARPLANLLAAQRPDGSFGSATLEQAAFEALQAVQEESAQAAALRLLAQRKNLTLPTFTCAHPAAALSAASALLATRHADGSFGAGVGGVIETARALGELARTHAFLKSHEPEQPTKGAELLPAFGAAPRSQAAHSLQRGADYLLTQRLDGGFGFDGHRDAGITAMVLGALLTLPEPRPAPVAAAIAEGLDYLVSLQHADGSIHEGQLANYVTSAAILALAQGGRAADLTRIQRASTFLRALQSDEPEGYTSESRYYGGVGYGNDERPDLSNLQMALEALHTAGVPASDPAFQKALTFLQRCQNRSESNALAVVVEGKTITSGNDGGAAYAPGESKAGFVELAGGKRVPRSYGSMSYALLKGYLFAGLSKDDERVQAVWSWLRANYTLDVNPGFEASDDPTAAYQGLFYYFYTMAKALDLFGEGSILDGAGQAHDWRAELSGRLVAMQRMDGSWINANSARWFEGNPVLATSYAILTLGTAIRQ